MKYQTYRGFSIGPNPHLHNPRLRAAKISTRGWPRAAAFWGRNGGRVMTTALSIDDAKAYIDGLWARFRANNVLPPYQERWK